MSIYMCMSLCVYVDVSNCMCLCLSVKGCECMCGCGGEFGSGMCGCGGCNSSSRRCFVMCFKNCCKIRISKSVGLHHLFHSLYWYICFFFSLLSSLMLMTLEDKLPHSL